jgi:hypothetical protein
MSTAETNKSRFDGIMDEDETPTAFAMADEGVL